MTKPNVHLKVMFPPPNQAKQKVVAACSTRCNVMRGRCWLGQGQTIVSKIQPSGYEGSSGDYALAMVKLGIMFRLA